jgi:general stress protein 26
MIANPWLSGPTPTQRLPHDRLTERITNLLSSQNMCVVATCGPDGPLATPMRYFHRDMTIFMTAAAGTPKLRNLAADPRVSIGVFAPLVSQASSRGAQLFGAAEILVAGDDGFDDGIEVYRWQDTAVERGRSLSEEPEGPLLRIPITRVVYTEHWLRRDGYAPRQHWRP